MKIVEKLWLGRLARPILDRHRPVYNWFPINEAFSRDLIFLLAETWSLGEGDTVLDPFCGTGTTLLACKELGVDCIGRDVHPLMLFAARVKLRDYDKSKLRELIGVFLKGEFESREVDAPKFVARVFPKPMLEEVTAVRQRVQEIDDESVREFLMLGLAAAAMRCSWARIDGAAIKVFKRLLPPLRRELGHQLWRMFKDVEGFKTKAAEIKVGYGDARKLDFDDGSVDVVITSPPYLGKKEYVDSHRIEQWVLGLEGPSTKNLIDAVSADGADDFSEVADFARDKMPESRTYFKDMLVAMKELYRVCRDGASVCMVVSDGCSQEGPVDVCVPLSERAEKAGFKAKSVVVVNKRHCTTPARKKLGIAREGLLFWEKT
ncbi:MAG: DNA methyltransferase [Methanobacteriota archaeon]